MTMNWEEFGIATLIVFILVTAIYLVNTYCAAKPAGNVPGALLWASKGLLWALKKMLKILKGAALILASPFVLTAAAVTRPPNGAIEAPAGTGSMNMVPAEEIPHRSYLPRGLQRR